MALYRTRMCGILLLLTLVGTSVAAEGEIHRCLLDDGTIAFQQLPCADPVEPPEPDAGETDDSDTSRAAADGAFDFVNPFDEPAAPVEAPPPAPASEDRAACEKAARDAIDAIDQEMRVTSYTPKQGQQYLAELLELTKQLRSCK
ncbi:MAG: hypothetical protein WBN09_06720 [Woeseiaceae bacterium]